MKLGAILGILADPSNPKALAEQARAYADQGYGSLWTAQTIGRGFMVPDPILSLAVAASVTDDLLLGTAILQVPLYHPLDLAHRLFSLKQIAGDRFIFGVGAGSTENDFQAFDRDYANRFEHFREMLQDLREIFETGRLGEVDLTPWPTTLGTPKLYLGSWDKGIRRAATEFDGWIASAMYRTIDQIEAAAVEYHQAGGQASVISSIIVNADTDLGELKDRFQRFSAMGFDHAVIVRTPGAASPEEVRKLLP